VKKLAERANGTALYMYVQCQGQGSGKCRTSGSLLARGLNISPTKTFVTTVKYISNTWVMTLCTGLILFSDGLMLTR
jgi:hypothetical protein